jgi:hypothetical protein
MLTIYQVLEIKFMGDNFICDFTLEELTVYTINIHSKVCIYQRAEVFGRIFCQ